jgi:cysteine synthase A
VSNSIGNTPLLELRRIAPAGAGTVLAKAEFMNPSGSLKDRIAKYMIERAEERGELRPGSTILEVTSGNTGIGLAMVGAEKGYRVIVVMPKCTSVERRRMILAFGAELELIEDLSAIDAARKNTRERARRDAKIWLPRQFENYDNPRCHYETTAQEIIRDAGNDVAAFLMGVGTGGTLMGVAKRLKEVNPAVQIIATEPAEGSVLLGEPFADHGIQGIADGFIPEIVDVGKIDRIVKVSTKDAIATAKRLSKEEGLFVGISAGANVKAALAVAQELGPDKKVVTILPDRGERYLSVLE